MSIQNVIDNGFCIGCGACKAVNPDAIDIKFYNGIYNAAVVEKERLNDVTTKVCPFSDDSVNETQLVEKNNTYNQSEHIGQYSNLYTGGVVNELDREQSSSGGMTSWVLSKLLSEGHVDSAIHVIETNDGQFEFQLVNKSTDLTHGKKSKYYPVTMGEILNQLEPTRTYAITGVPCFIKSIKLLQTQGYFTNIKYTLALFCGHFKTSYFSEMLSWELGIKPSEIANVDFRKKVKGHAASDYFVEVTNKSGKAKQGRISEMFGTNWAHGLFKPKACDFCDDICGELADVTFGDAWLPEYTNNWLGTNIVISRNSTIDNIISSGLKDNEILLNEIPELDVIKSQDANFRHRRGGILSRIKTLQLNWYPKKRLELCQAYYNETRDHIYKKRWELSEASGELFSKAKFKRSYVYFKLPMYLKIVKYDVELNGLLNFLRSEIRKKLAKAFRILGLRKGVK